MSRDNDSTDLTGKLLIAMPGMGDPRFEKSVIFICAHSPDDAMGLIVNKPAPGLNMADLFEQLDIPSIDLAEGKDGFHVQFGGPVEHARGFVLHSGEYTDTDSTLQVDPDFSMTANKDILESIANGQGPDRAVLMLGYSGWGPGQLEQEIVDNGWLVTDASPEIVFGSDSSVKWTAALKTLGVDPIALSAVSGRA